MISSVEIKAFARQCGFGAAGIAPASPLSESEAVFQEWIEAVFHGGMKYLEDFAGRKKKFEREIPNAKSIIVLGVSYFSDGKAKLPETALSGRVARYAWGRDYHLAVKERLKAVEDFILARAPQARCLSCVDTRPILERSYAERAGLGFRGKHTNLLSREFGPWFFLSEIITDLVLEPDSKMDHGSCGTCTDCLDICPTRAIVASGIIDARKCIAYLTIEHKGVIPREMRPFIGEWVFGCDECLQGCPFTRFAKETSWPEFRPESGAGSALDLLALFELKTNSEYEARFSSTPLLRATRKMMLRNAAIVLGNRRDERTVPVLRRALKEESSLVKIHAAWALGRIGSFSALNALREALDAESDADVRSEIQINLLQPEL